MTMKTIVDELEQLKCELNEIWLERDKAEIILNKMTYSCNKMMNRLNSLLRRRRIKENKMKGGN